ncbi:16S rRNA (cytosine(1402)-N(4))-methyltransferase RsmH [Chitinivorax sp. B]|uniref:16S rRNA (cytosine(1402)-N(4))-methyltransferase RsmH n=1 Tax=Chitinivorax sp. B TaxID=2502235 RepID=UPI0010F69638|nr:16S rRNA (cytosine(1402)-N(4))-methyltransferase RsmH [Chitinivorax sp. B]
MTDANGFVHRTVLLQEAVDALAIKPDGIYVDGTFGRGGHSRLILSRLGPNGRLISFDKDLQAIAEAHTIDDTRFTIVHNGFTHLERELAQLGIEVVDGVLLDLGISSPQVDDGSRGFSFRFDAPLDMRMDTTRGVTAAEWLATAPEQEIYRVIKEYGEERFAKQIARKIVAVRTERAITTTRQLAEVVASCVRSREPGQDPSTRSFQAIRIHVNQELEELSLVLPQAMRLLRAGGRMSVISFHSLEDRIVKRFMKDAANEDDMPSRLPIRAADLKKPPMHIIGKPIRPSEDEVKANSRARSAILRVAERTESPL